MYNFRKSLEKLYNSFRCILVRCTWEHKGGATVNICGIIKPHAVHQAQEIQRALREAGILILESKEVCFDMRTIEILYDHMSHDARASIAEEFARDGRVGTALLLEVQSIQRLLEVVGTESDPRACKRGTIRARFGVHEEPVLMGAEVWWKNAFHRPIDMREAVRDLYYIFGIS